MILIKNGRVVDPVTGVDEAMDVLIEGAHIEEVGRNLSAAGAEVIDASGLVVAPGLVDTMSISGIRDRLIRRIF